MLGAYLRYFVPCMLIVNTNRVALSPLFLLLLLLGLKTGKAPENMLYLWVTTRATPPYFAATPPLLCCYITLLN